MGHGTISYHVHQWIDWASTAKRTLLTIEVILYFVFVIDCFVAVASMGSTGSYFPAGGGSLIALLLLIGLVHRLRCGRDYSNS